MSEKSFSQILQELSKPFPTKAVQWRPGATNREKTSAQALAFVDMRDYQDRLNEVCPDWQSRVQVVGEGVVKVSLIIAGITREEIGEADPADDNTYTSAVAQAFKRACAAFGLGRYLYRLPKVWCDYDSQRRKLLEIPVLPQWAVPADERPAYGTLYAGQRKIALDGRFQNQPSQSAKSKPATRPTQPKGNGNGDLAGIVIKYGKYQGRKLGDLSAEELAEVAAGNSWIAKRAAEYKAQKAPSPANLPVAAAPSGNEGGNGAPPPPEPDPFDDIPF